MSELFSNIRIIDYLIIFETSILSIDNDSYNDYIQKVNKNIQTKKRSHILINYEYKTINIFPKFNYKKENPDFYTLNISSILTFLPQEFLYTDKPNELYFPLIFTSENGTYYYGHFLRMFFQIDFNDKIYVEHPELLKNKTPLFTSKYLCFVSLNPFFISFKNLLIEIYNQSVTNNSKCFKVENIINTILFRMVLPKYESTQLLFCLGDNVYSFSKTPFRNEISFRLLFSYISIKNIVMIIISILMNSIVVIIHSNMEIITPIIHSLFELVFPFLPTYSIVSNLTPGKIDLLGNFSNTIFGIYSKDFKDLSEIKNANNSNYVILDIDRNKLDIEHNEYFQQKFPIGRIKNLIKELCQFADIFQTYTNESNVLSSFQNKSANTFEQYKNFAKVNFRTKNYYNSKKINEEKFDDNMIRACFFDFMLGLFEKYDEKKHYKITNEATQDKTFDREKFLKDAPLDIQPFLEYIIDQQTFDIFLQNVNHIVDQKHKNELKKLSYKYGNLEIKRNPEIREKSLFPEFEMTYKIFMIGLERRRNRKNLETLFKLNIYHTISIASPPYETLPYHQNNIFIDPINEKLIKYDKAVKYDKTNLEMNILHISLEEQKNLIPSLLYKEYDDLIKSKFNKNNTNKKVKLNEILTRISTELFTEQKTEPIMIEFKKMLSKYSQLIKKYYALSSQETKQYLKKIIDNSKNKLFLSNNKQQLLDRTNLNQSKGSKKEYIKSSNLLISNFPSDTFIGTQSDFRINFGLNVIYTVAFCDYCSRPNSIWDIRKDHEYRQLKKASVTKCKFCQQNFVPCFYVIEEEEKQSSTSNLLKINTMSTSSSPFQYYKTKSIRKVEYMCYDHIIEAYTEFFNIIDDTNASTIPKFPYDLFYNVCLLLGEINCSMNENKELQLDTLDVFIQNYFIKNPEAVNNYTNNNTMIMKKSITFSKTSNNDLSNKKKYQSLNATMKKNNVVNTISNRESIASKKSHRKKHIKNIMTVKFDLKDLVNETKYNQFQKDINKIHIYYNSNVK